MMRRLAPGSGPLLLVLVTGGCGDAVSTGVDEARLFQSVAAGATLGCGVRGDGEAACWSLTSPTPQPLLEGRALSDAPGAVAPPAWWSGDTCAIDRDGRVACNQPIDELGDAPPFPEDVVFRSLSRFADGVCAVAADGALWCMGYGWAGALGPHEELPADCAEDWCIPAARLFPHLAFRSVAMGPDHGCGITTAGETWCWGSNANGQIARGAELSGDDCAVPNCVFAPARLEGAPPLSALAAGDAHTCGLADGDVWCWGARDAGQLADGGGAEPAHAPTRVETEARFGSISAARSTTCALDTGGTAWCWGDHQDSFSPAPLDPSRARPVPVAGVSFTSISVGGSHACGIARTAGAMCWEVHVEAPRAVRGQF